MMAVPLRRRIEVLGETISNVYKWVKGTDVRQTDFYIRGYHLRFVFLE